MHDTSIWHMKDIFRRRFVEAGVAPGRVLEVGSAARKTPFKDVFIEGGWRYVGADLVPRSNVDVVLDDPYVFPFKDGEFQAIISGQMLEHNQFFWLSFLEMARVLAPGGLMFHIAPSRGHEHRTPQDCWRFYRDGFKAMAKWTGIETLEVSTDWSRADLEILRKKKPLRLRKSARRSKFPDGRWGDTVGVFRKPENHRPELALNYIKTLAAKWG